MGYETSSIVAVVKKCVIGLVLVGGVALAASPVMAQHGPRGGYSDRGRGSDHHDEEWYLGVRGRVIPREGLLVTYVDRHSPADHAGLRCGDIIHSINGHDIACYHDFEEGLECSRGLARMLVHQASCGHDVKIVARLEPVHHHHHPYDRPAHFERRPVVVPQVLPPPRPSVSFGFSVRLPR